MYLINADANACSSFMKKLLRIVAWTCSNNLWKTSFLMEIACDKLYEQPCFFKMQNGTPSNSLYNLNQTWLSKYDCMMTLSLQMKMNIHQSL